MADDTAKQTRRERILSFLRPGGLSKQDAERVLDMLDRDRLPSPPSAPGKPPADKE